MTDLPTIELFPGVQFRKDTTRPLGNQWLFLHEEHWLIAKLAYADDIMLDHVAQLIAANGTVSAISVERRNRLNAARKAAGIGPDDDLVAAIEGLRTDAERYRYMRDCPWPGHMMQVGICAAGDDDNWLGGADADRAIDAARAPRPEPTPAAKPWSEAAEPVPEDQRQCHSPDCWECEGTGRSFTDNGICNTNNALPF